MSSSLAEIDESRGRIQAAADDERRRIERDLHDGAQQRLVALRIKIELAEELLREDPAKGLSRLHLLGDEVTDTLDEIRSIARGVYPSLLAERGLPEALHAAALRAPMETHVSPDGVGRYPQAVESAVYFCCLEALQNAAKHAPGASRVTVDLHEDDRLRFEVSDDGEGFDVRASADGMGLTNMRDRLEAVGGTLRDPVGAGAGVADRGERPAALGGGRGVLERRLAAQRLHPQEQQHRQQHHRERPAGGGRRSPRHQQERRSAPPPRRRSGAPAATVPAGCGRATAARVGPASQAAATITTP